MATRAQKVKVGVFLFSTIALFIFVLIIISGMQRHPTSTYFAVFNESVTGLDKGGEVRFNGVPIGQVDDIQIGDKGTVLVTMKIRRDRMPELRVGQRARLQLRGVTGIIYVEIYGNPTGSVILPGGAIPTDPSFLTNVTLGIPQMLDSLNAILTKTNKALGEPDTKFGEQLEGVFTQISDTTNALTNFTNRATSQTIIVSENLNKYIARLDNLTSDVNKHVNVLLPDLDKAVNRLDKRLEDLDILETQKKIQLLAEQLTSATIALETFIANTDANISDVEYDLRRSLRRVQSMLSAAEALIRTLERDPSVLIYGHRPPEKAKNPRR
ncbi:MAG TPA: MlaD family protein [Candidatus Sumerlaeota bacterium]|nr:MAG: mce related protein [candidate division BRC1 bacterium ADurb.Bin183]HOE64578.1 MlaD family protein [Candidatus Sumerlaeota bacterium]HRR30009.1 MlaD family protein [Candidatus Sumerlaeia bacterium]HON49463.1 MlaD family protein [Candidatus Sumerlaeota bacterium]HOR64787.1 MlaD family protein [Candidatus Sumerlaeota bacterium]